MGLKKLNGNLWDWVYGYWISGFRSDLWITFAMEIVWRKNRYVLESGKGLASLGNFFGNNFGDEGAERDEIGEIGNRVRRLVKLRSKIQKGDERRLRGDLKLWDAI